MPMTYADRPEHRAATAAVVEYSVFETARMEAAEVKTLLAKISPLLVGPTPRVILAAFANCLAETAILYREGVAIEISHRDLAQGFSDGMAKVLFRILARQEGVPESEIDKEIGSIPTRDLSRRN